MIRDVFLPFLPSDESVRLWNTSKNFEPGVHVNTLEYVENLNEQEKKKGTILVYDVIFDEVHLNCTTNYNSKTHKWEGSVDLGGDLPQPNQHDESKNNKLAKKALVFMIVSINGNFKVPVAYYLCDSLTGADKATLITVLLGHLHKHNIPVVSFTCDGDQSNQAAFKVLGAQFDYFKEKYNFKPFFINSHNQEKIYIFFDSILNKVD